MGLEKEKETLAMPEEMVLALKGYVEEQALNFSPVQQKCTDDKAPVQLAKYLGKFYL